MSDRFSPFLALLSTLFIGACGGGQVTVHNPSIPEPLIDQLPLNVAARYPEAFDKFVHEEELIGKETWSIDLGASNRLLFTQLFSSMFTDFQVIGADTDPQEVAFDALIEPSIDAFEFSVPKQSQTDDFAVWIRYRIKIFDSGGVQIANWPIAAYGKSQTASLRNDEALRRAAILAMRDAAALIILQMDRATGISQLSEANARQAAPPPPAPAPDDIALNASVEEPADESE